MKPGRISAAAAADMIGVSGVTFAKLMVEGAFARQAPKAGYDLKKVVRGTVQHYMRRAAGRAGEDGGVLLMKERALLASEQRETAHLRNMVTRGEYVKLDSMQRLVEHDYAVVRERILTVPGKAADSLQPYTAKDRQAIMEILTSEAHEALADLSSDEFWFRKKMTRVKAMRGKPKAVADVDDAKELAT